ncbi:MAG: alanine/ornithine racemase family PLP-dependent enzyme [Acidimicrobiales bacterium]
MSAPRLEVDLEKIGHNARELVDRAARCGISVTAVTKAMLGSPELARVLVASGVDGLGDSRVENIERMRSAGIDAPMLLLRSPMVSQIDRVVATGAMSVNTSPEVLSALAASARAAGRVHDVMIMVELGDLREGVMPAELHGVVRHVLDRPSLRLRGIGANLACRNGIEPSVENMAQLSDMIDGVEASFGVEIDVVSGGNSANLVWALSGEAPGRINDLRLGEAILLGCEPLHRQPLPGLHTDAFTLVAEVIESARKPTKPWGRAGQNSFGETPAAEDRGDIWQTILAIGRQDTDATDLAPPAGVDILAASSDHLIVQTRDRMTPGDEIRFTPGYSALLRSTTSPFVDHGCR